MLQAWTTLRNSHMKYWRVDIYVRKDIASSHDCPDARSTDSSTLEQDDSNASELLQMEAEEGARLPEKHKDLYVSSKSWNMTRTPSSFGAADGLNGSLTSPYI